MDRKDRQLLLRKWKELQSRPLHGFRDWEDFAAFAQEQGYTAGKLMVKKDRQRIHSRENTVFLTEAEARELREEQRRERKKKYRQDQKESFQRRFVGNWNANIHRDVQPEKKELPRNERGREVFRYEHPDIVRRNKNKR